MKIHHRLIIITSIIFLNFSCSTKKSIYELRNHFSNEQINDLNKISDFFQSQICDVKNSDFKTCFLDILPQLLEFGWQPILEKVDFDKQIVMYSSISQSTFDEIWIFNRATFSETGLKFKSLGSKYNGKYQKYLTELGKNNSQIKLYAENLINAGEFETMGLLQRSIANNPTDFDLDDQNIQILIAIHFLTQNDQQKRTEKWIENQNTW